MILVANDTDIPRAATPRDSSPYVHVSRLTPSTVAHELGHFFEWRGSLKSGHADVARDFFRDEYADRTCIMGGRDKFSFQDAMIPALTNKPFSTRSGPGMNPALVDQCGWLDVSSPLVAVIDPVVLSRSNAAAVARRPAQRCVRGCTRRRDPRRTGPRQRTALRVHPAGHRLGSRVREPASDQPDG